MPPEIWLVWMGIFPPFGVFEIRNIFLSMSVPMKKLHHVLPVIWIIHEICICRSGFLWIHQWSQNSFSILHYPVSLLVHHVTRFQRGPEIEIWMIFGRDMCQKLIMSLQILGRVKFRPLEASTTDPMGISPKVNAVCILWDQDQLQKKK